VIHRLFAALIVLALALAAGGGGAREWKPTAQSLAENYAQIVDRRSPHEVVFVMWLVPELLPDGPESALARQILDDYLVIAVIHADVSELGEFSFRKVEDLTVNTETAGRRRRTAGGRRDVVDAEGCVRSNARTDGSGCALVRLQWRPGIQLQGWRVLRSL